MSLTIHSGPAPAVEEIALHKKLSSQIDLKDDLIADIIAAMETNGWFKEGDRHWLLLCLDEAIVNAMIHGNEGDPSLEITVQVGHDASTDRWVIVVDDQGEGFTPDSVPDVNDPDSLLLEHGRGILLMTEWLDELTYYNGGSTIYMARACNSHDTEGNEA